MENFKEGNLDWKGCFNSLKPVSLLLMKLGNKQSDVCSMETRHLESASGISSEQVIWGNNTTISALVKKKYERGIWQNEISILIWVTSMKECNQFFSVVVIQVFLSWWCITQFTQNGINKYKYYMGYIYGENILSGFKSEKVFN